MENTTINCTEIFIEIIGVRTHYNEKRWIEDLNEDEGGSFQYIQQKYSKPLIEIYFECRVDIELQINGIYTDGVNAFRALETNTIVNSESVVSSFAIPKKLMLIAKPFSEK